MYLAKLNKRIDKVVVALKQIDHNLGKAQKGRRGAAGVSNGRSIAE